MAEYVLDTTRAPEIWRALDPFTRGYVEAAMWTLTDEEGRSCDHLGLHSVAPAALDAARVECTAFKAAYQGLLDAVAAFDATVGDEQHGHDFWLTRNGHGAGYWDRGYPKGVRDALTAAATAAGTSDWYLGDDGLVYAS